MKAKQIIAAIALLTAGSAFAEQTFPYVDFTGHVSTKTRAEVVAEMKQATPAQNTEYVEFKAAAVPGKTRTEVRAELANANTQAADGSQEYVEFKNIASTRSRDEVRKEAVQAAHGKEAKVIGAGS